MEIVHIDLDNVKYIGNLNICLGYFDAFHIGHIALINKAKEDNNKVALLTMEPNPKQFFTSNDIKFINSFDDKCNILESLGIDYFIILKTEKRVLDLSPDEFVNKVLIPLGVYKVVCGFDYTFGKDRLGNVDTLRLLGNQRCFKVDVINEVLSLNNKKVSSTYIQDLISQGQIEIANKYLYIPYMMHGHVNHGNHIGNTFGYATANIDVDSKYLMPKKGVYYGKCLIGNKEYDAMINVGTHPTIKESKYIVIEAHILDFNNDIYGYEVDVSFLKYIREEKKFNSLDDLIIQLKKDEQTIRELILKK